MLLLLLLLLLPHYYTVTIYYFNNLIGIAPVELCSQKVIVMRSINEDKNLKKYEVYYSKIKPKKAYVKFIKNCAEKNIYTSDYFTIFANSMKYPLIIF